MWNKVRHYVELAAVIIVCSLVWLMFTTVFAPEAKSQATANRIIFVLVTPSGSCTSKFLPLQYQVNTGIVYGCVGGVWTAIGGGGGGATTFSQLGCSVTRTTSTRLTIFSDATSTTPCVVRSQNAVYRFTAPATVDISAGTATAYIYTTASGVLAVGHNGLTLTCTGCTAVASVTAFPSQVATLFQWDGSSGTWATTGLDGRAFANAFPWTGSTGLTCSVSSGVQTCSIDGTVIVQKFTGSGAPGTIAASLAGDIYTDTATGTIYACKTTACTASDWIAAGGSGGVDIYVGATSAISVSTSDVDIYSVSVPAVATGKGVQILFAWSTAGNILPKVKFGSDTLACTAPGAGGNPFSAAGFWKMGLTLGNTTDQSHQQINGNGPMIFSGDTNFFECFPSATDTLFTQTWSGAVTLKIVAISSGSTTVTGHYLHVFQ